MEPEEGGERECRVVAMRRKTRWNVRGVSDGAGAGVDCGLGLEVCEDAGEIIGVGVRASLFAFASFRRMASTRMRAYRLPETFCSNEGDTRNVCPLRASVNATTVKPISA